MNGDFLSLISKSVSSTVTKQQLDERTILILGPTLEDSDLTVKSAKMYMSVSDNNNWSTTPTSSLINYIQLEKDPGLDLSFTKTKLNLYVIPSKVNPELLSLPIINNHKTDLIIVLNAADFSVTLTEELSEWENVKLKLINRLKVKLVPILEKNNGWSSVSVLMTNCSEWNYCVLTMPAVDFIQQILRVILLHYNSKHGGCLCYFHSNIENDRMQLVWKSILEEQPQCNLDLILDKFDDIFVPVSKDSSRKIEILDEQFEESKWWNIWNTESNLEYVKESSNKELDDVVDIDNLYQEFLHKLIIPSP